MKPESIKNESIEIEIVKAEETREVTGLVEERLTVEIPTEIQAGLTASCANCVRPS